MIKISYLSNKTCFAKKNISCFVVFFQNSRSLDGCNMLTWETFFYFSVDKFLLGVVVFPNFYNSIFYVFEASELVHKDDDEKTIHLAIRLLTLRR